MKPKLKDLQNFAKQYFPYKCPAVRWKRIEGYNGQAYTEKNIIYLNPEIPLNCWGCKTGEATYAPKAKIKMRGGEQYFLVLIHEIGHFKIKLKPPKYFKELKKRTIKAIKLYRKLRDKIRSENKSRKKITLDEIVTEIDYDSSLNRKFFTKGKWDEGKWLEFRSWLGRDLMSEHIKVEDWAIREFKKQRKKIKEILKQ